MEPYFTVVIPWVAPRFATKWHPSEREGAFSTLTRGNFASEDLAIEWASARLNGTLYSVRKVEVDDGP